MALISSSIGGLWKAQEFIISASSLANVETIPYNDFRSFEYIITFYNDTEGVYKSLYLRVSKKNNDVSDTVFGKTGDNIDIEVNPKKVLTNYVLEIQNNESFDVSMRVSKLTHN